jgi:hypothetical protein
VTLHTHNLSPHIFYFNFQVQVFCFNPLRIPKNLKPIYNSKRHFLIHFFGFKPHKSELKTMDTYAHVCLFSSSYLPLIWLLQKSALHKNNFKFLFLTSSLFFLILSIFISYILGYTMKENTSPPKTWVPSPIKISMPPSSYFQKSSIANHYSHPFLPLEIIFIKSSTQSSCYQPPLACHMSFLGSSILLTL